MLGSHVAAAAAPGQPRGPVDRVAGFRGLWRGPLRGLASCREQLAGSGTHCVGPHSQLLQDRRRDALAEQADELVMGADLGGPVRGGLPAGGLQAGQQPRLALQSRRADRWRPLREPLPGRLFGHPDPLADLRPRAPRLARFLHEVANHLVGA